MTTTTTEKKKIKVTMSERAPLKIDPEVWPLIASADWHDGQVLAQANYVRWIKVREHDDGRRLVYGAYDSGNGGTFAGFRGSRGGFLVEAASIQGDGGTFAGFRGSRGGFLAEAASIQGDGLDAGKTYADAEGTVRAIRRVAGIIGDDTMADECIADLPAEELA